MHRNAAHLFLGLFLALAPFRLEATISLQIGADRLNDASGNAAPTTTLALIVADTSGDGLGPVRPGSIALNAPLNGSSGDDIIVVRTDLSVSGTAGVLSTFASGLDFASVTNGTWGAGDPLYLVWFPTLISSDTTLSAGVAYGAIPLGSTPGDGDSESLFYISPTNTGAFSQNPTQNATNTSANQTSSNPSAPEIALLGNNAAIADGSTTASTTNHTDFGSTAAAGSNTVVRTFTISNTDGTAALNITLPIEITGTHEADFTVTTAPATSVNAGGSTTFQVTFNPSAVGVRTATISITNSDADEGTYDFAISGTGANSAPADISLSNATLAENGSANAVIGSFSTTDADATDSHSYSLVAGEGSTHNSAFTISGSNLTINAPADFETLNQYSVLVRTTDGAATFDKQFTITVTNVNEAPASIALSSNSLPENSGANAVVGTLSAADPDANSTFTFSLVQGSNDNSSFNIFNNTLRMNASADFETKNSYTVLVRVEDNGSPALGIERPLTINITDVEEVPGTISLSSTTLAENNSAEATVGALTLIDNTAVGTVTYSLVDGNGSGDNGSFTVSPSGSLSINGVADFEQKASYKIRVQAADSATPPTLTPTEFTINVTNVNEAPVFVKGPDIEVPVGATTLQTVTGWATDIDDGDSTVTQSLTFNVSVTGDSILSQPPAIASNGTLTYTPNGSTGVATVSVTLTDDTSINSQAAITTASAQTFTITAAAPGIVVMGSNNLSISNGDADPSITDGTDFGSALVSSGTVQRTFTIENDGNTSLTLGTLSIEGTDQADFTPTQPSEASIPAGGNTTFTITFDPSAPGERSATVSIVNGDPSKNPFTFAIQGNGTQPGLEVRGNGVIIASTDTILRTENGTDFGRVTLLNTQIVKTFTITNTGSAPLNLTGNPLVALNGPAAGDFSVTLLPDASLQPQATTTFSIAFNPALPGQRIATVTIENESTPFLFNVGGFGTLSTLLSQSISFAPPAVVYVDQNPVSFPLEATATSGLPVSFAVTGPASLNGNVLTITSPGNVRIVATQPGGGNYAAARALVRVIAAKASPQSLTLLDLNQTYDGSPKPISVIGAQGAVITYVVNRAETPVAPTNAGTYVVKAQAGNVVKTGKLVIAKATLTVTPDDKRKFVGEANPALTFTIAGFLGTDTGSVVTRQPVLTTRARTTSYGGLYPITASGAAALNYNFVYRQATLVIESFAGNYESLLSSGDPQLPVGKLSIAISRSSNTFTARLFTEKETSPLGFSGSLVTDAGAEIASGEDDVTTRAGTNYTVRFTLPLKGDSTMEAEFTPLSAATATPLGSSQNGKRLAAFTRVPYSGAHTAILQPALPASSTVPAGAGWATASVSRTGGLSLSGRLGDGTPFTAGLSPDTGESPGYRLFIQPYKKPFRIGTYVAGDFQLKPHPDLAGRRYLDTAALTWRKAEQLSDSSYRQPFGPVTTDLSIDPWLPPTRTVTLASRLGLSSPPSPFVVSHSDTGITSQTNLPTELALSSRNVVSVVNPALNVTKWKTGFTTKNGLFSGSFELVNDGATTKRTVKFSGILRQPPLASGDGVIGDGHFVLPAPSIGGAATTGEVLFQSPPVQPNP